MTSQNYLPTSPHTAGPLSVELLSWMFLPTPTEMCNRILKSTGCSLKNSLSPGLGVSLSLLSHPLSRALSVCLPPFLSLPWYIDLLNAFRTSHLTSCKCCFSSSERPLGVQRGNLADRSFSFFPLEERLCTVLYYRA